jgi:hypothetical protein
MSSWLTTVLRRARWAALVALTMIVGSEGGPLFGRQPAPDAVWQPAGNAARSASQAARIAGGGAVVVRF